MQELTGRIAHQSLGVGVWVLETAAGVNYELRDLPQVYQQPGLKVTVTGEVLADTVSVAMVGPIFAVGTVTKL
ncbi:DUF5818 domain-containing protein [Picosynechococcus sp. PCC 73109]|uniref:DUF5818 domain-containing protein n=1 Tax=Picosynechococcus sp. PCC 73109 TaxID=374982 RepID=UPI00074596A3|nr:DUF5818 domain-containing protein [Picosynechococcus sp. PCC 73109]AMA08149.1 hypothetical protein AWQ23_01790 [Picosynechococcus sp. PCC 73109]